MLVSHSRQIQGTFWFVIPSLAGLGVGRQIADDGIDILIDLTGYTTHSRPTILALQPAPLIVQHTGYINTLRAAFVEDGKPRYVTALGATSGRQAWRENKLRGGVLLKVGATGTVPVTRRRKAWRSPRCARPWRRTDCAPWPRRS